MVLTLEEVEHIAKLARLNLSEEEKSRYREQLSQILEYAGRLQELATENISPTFRVLQTQSRLRADESRSGLAIQDLLCNAPETESNQFRVPPILE
jgi:aspartyl-tRNA(Asn)/glutamyl-tRNA(Gln) amidotransferase subunit C